ncbi:MAG: hypothetical protein HC922_00350 [Leptolyngbyaceae cyanobacterium SM2_3_12]|nr:hypothetical protein [Leptolyngbyaceae cyanobacterium SM2_3_12]
MAAFKQRNYPQALALFQQVSQMEQAAPADRLKAEMGLVQVHRQVGQHTLPPALSGHVSQSVRRCTAVG